MTGVAEVEGRLVARAQQVVRLLLPQGDRAADVGADLRVAQDARHLPVLAGGRDVDRRRIHPDDDDRRLGLLLLVLDAVVVLEVLRLRVDQLADLDVGGLDRLPADVVHQTDRLLRGRLGEDGPLDRLGPLAAGRPRTHVGEGHHERQGEQAQCAAEAAHHEPAAGDAGVTDPVTQHHHRVGTGLLVRVRNVPLLDDLLVAHDVAGPGDGPDTDEEDRQAHRGPEDHVVQVGVERTDLDLDAERDREVRHHGGQGGQCRDREGDHDAALRVLVRVRVRGDPAGDVRLEARIVDRSLELVGRVVVHLERAPFEVIQVASRTRPPMPTTQAHRPSVTGPMLPRDRPPPLEPAPPFTLFR
ncbi:hypothetical protein SDC9_71644 [bioreactor metagenome]|uniref:Uncharacterized protein n=1 Tax=bioreactor metagenome TaxID=1076179 RepID=A0A644YGB9_9ZZZZ